MPISLNDYPNDYEKDRLSCNLDASTLQLKATFNSGHHNLLKLGKFFLLLFAENYHVEIVELFIVTTEGALGVQGIIDCQMNTSNSFTIGD